MNGRYLNHRGIAKRYFIRGRLELTSPTHLGNGDAEDLIDMPIRIDEVSKYPLLPGASLAGALRSYLHTRVKGYGVKDDAAHLDIAQKLFGYVSDGENPVSKLSWLMVDDARATTKPGLELRDGVRISPQTRTAADKKKFDVELLPAGTTFDFSLEFWMPGGAEGTEMLRGLATALCGLQNGEIRLGARKTRGFGECKVTGWSVTCYDMSKPDEVLGWIQHQENSQFQEADILTLLNVSALPDKREQLRLTARFAIRDTLLIRSSNTDPQAPDVVHIRTGKDQALFIPGTSLAGVLRGRAARILQLLCPTYAQDRLYALFGPDMDDENIQQPAGSRIVIRDSKLELARELIQMRVMIDRFTGGALPQHLFDEQILTGGEFEVQITVRNPTTQDIGLLLFLLKDLWTGDLPLGGESSVGRGRLQGKKATLEYANNTWVITAKNDAELEFSGTGKTEDLQTYANSLKEGGTK